MLFTKKIKQKNKKASNAEQPFILPQTFKHHLLFIQVFNLLTLIAELSFWFISLSVICLVWQFAIHQRLLARPSNFVKSFVSIAGCCLLVISAKSMGVLLGMIHLLCLAYLLKPFEINQRKDLYQIVVQGFFILATAFIFSQSIYFTLVIFTITVVNLAWLHSYFSTFQKVNNHLKISFKLILQSLPLAIILFLFLPKLSPLWHVPLANSAKTGLSDKVTIGDISNLALSNELAFRVEFDNTTPNYNEMYWRTLVLDQFDGTSWRRSKKSKQDIVNAKSLVQKLDLTKNQISYQVIAEPSFQRWLFALDVARLDDVKQNKIVFQLQDQTILSREKIAQTLSYSVTSFIDNPIEPQVKKAALQEYLTIEQQSNPLLVSFADKLRRDFSDDKTIVNQVLSTFRLEDYRYTLNPPILTNNSLDEFFFNTKAGFCEHYASSFTFLMRAAGIPARMVVGYLGGQFNTKGNYFSILQRDAHAWSEVWFEGEGWVRVDPTAAVDPSRVEQGFSSQLLLEKESLSTHFDFKNYLSGAWLNQLMLQFEALDYQWTKLVVSFSQEKQKQLLNQWFGDNVDYQSAIIIAVSMVVMGMVIWLIHWLSKRVNRSPAWIRYYQHTHHKLNNLGLMRSNAQMQKHYTGQVWQFDGQLGGCYQQLISSYEKLKYQEISEFEKLQLQQQINEQYKQLSARIKVLINTKK